jgi:hypothetical protein
VSKAAAVPPTYEVRPVVVKVIVQVVIMKVSVHCALQIEITDISYDIVLDSQAPSPISFLKA